MRPCFIQSTLNKKVTNQWHSSYILVLIQMESKTNLVVLSLHVMLIFTSLSIVLSHIKLCLDCFIYKNMIREILVSLLAYILNLLFYRCPTDAVLFPKFTHVLQGKLQSTFNVFRPTQLVGGTINMDFTCTLQVFLGQHAPVLSTC